LAVKYWIEGGRIRMGCLNASNWWKNICDVRDGVGVHEVGWFEANLGRHIGNGKRFSIWIDPWLDEGLLCDKFSRLFDLFVDSNITVAEIRRLGWEVGGGNFSLGKMSWFWTVVLC